MKRLLRIELHKLRGNRSFIVLIALYFVALLLTLLTMEGILNTLFRFRSPQMPGFAPRWDINSFPEVWHYMTWLGGFFHYILMVIVIILICNEFGYRTVRQNVINGLSRTEFLAGKFLLMGALAAISTVMVFIAVMILGLVSSEPFEMKQMFDQAAFMPAYFVQTIGYMMLAFFIGMLVRRAGVAIGITMIYTWFLEKVIVHYAPEAIEDYFPIQAMNNMIRVPFIDLVDNAVQKTPALADIGLSVFYILVFGGLSLWWLKRRDI